MTAGPAIESKPRGPRLARTRPGGRLVLDPSAGIRAGLVTAFEGIVAHARHAAADPDPKRAVHELRKTLRRARAVLRFAGPLVRADSRRVIQSRLARAMRGTSSLRDAHVIAATLRRVPEAARTRGVRRAFEAWLRDIHRGEAAPARVARAVRSAVDLLDGVERLFDSGLVHDVAWRDLQASLRRSHRRVRRAFRDVRRHGEDEQVHELRKRVKELRYELELLAASRARWIVRRYSALAALAEDLGEVTDLLVLHENVRAFLEATPAQDGSRLGDSIRRVVRKRLARVLRRAESIATRRPKRFAQKALRAIRAAVPPRGAARESA